MFDDTTVFTGLDVHKAQALQAFRGIQKTVAYSVVAETHDLVPGERAVWVEAHGASRHGVDCS